MGNNSQLIILLIFATISALSWVFGKLKEQSELKRARDEARRKRDEELRTGRVEQPSPTSRMPPTPAQVRAQDMAARRQAQLEELRRQQQARTQMTLPGGVVIVRGPVPGPTAPAPPRRGPAVPTTVPAPARRPQGRPSGPTAAPRGTARPAPSTPPKPVSAPLREAAARPAPSTDAAAGKLEARPRPFGQRGSASLALFLDANGHARPPADLRAVIGAIEVLGPPVSARRDERLF